MDDHGKGDIAAEKCGSPLNEKRSTAVRTALNAVHVLYSLQTCAAAAVLQQTSRILRIFTAVCTLHPITKRKLFRARHAVVFT